MLFIAMTVSAMTSCNKEPVLTEDSLQNQETATIPSEVSEPLQFESLSDLQNAITSGSVAPSVRSSSDFISYAESEMTDDSYDNDGNVILSEAFGKVLNQDGKVVFGDILVRIGKCGVLYGPVSRENEIDRLAEKEDLRPFCRKSACPYLPGVGESYSVEGTDGIFLIDTFCMMETSVTSVGSEGEAKTRSVPGDVTWGKNETVTGASFDTGYTRPNGTQKNIFSCNKSIANDTKFYKQNYGVYYESGVKTKTMKKKGLFWNKFAAEVTSAVTDVCIHETGIEVLSELDEVGWADVNNCHYKGMSFLIATKVVNSFDKLPLTNDGIVKDCNEAYQWCRSKGVNISPVDGVRYVVKDSPKDAVTRLKDIVVTKNDGKNTLIFNLLTNYNNFYSDAGVMKNLTINRGYYTVDLINYYGYSCYNKEKLGSILKCRRLL